MSSSQLKKSWAANPFPGTGNVTTFNDWRAYNGTMKNSLSDIAWNGSAITFTYDDGESTAIEAITSCEADATSAPLYSIDGRIVKGTPRPGIYVRAGKKFVVK